MTLPPPSRTPDEALADLMAGNDRFARGELTASHHHPDPMRAEEPPRPKALILGCIDSRVPVESVFDQSFGEIFVARLAGNIVSDDTIASMKIALASGASLVVILGHSRCEAVRLCVRGSLGGRIAQALEPMQPIVRAVRQESEGLSEGLSEDELVERVIEANVRHGVREAARLSPVLRERIEAGHLKIVGGVYDLKTGRVRWLSDEGG